MDKSKRVLIYEKIIVEVCEWQQRPEGVTAEISIDKELRVKSIWDQLQFLIVL